LLSLAEGLINFRAQNSCDNLQALALTKSGSSSWRDIAGYQSSLNCIKKVGVRHVNNVAFLKLKVHLRFDCCPCLSSANQKPTLKRRSLLQISTIKQQRYFQFGDDATTGFF
jgi:hypothetical protein